MPFPDAKTLLTYYPQALAVVGTIALWLQGRATYRKGEDNSIREASATWREVADARKQRIEELLMENKDLKDEITRLRVPRKIGGRRP